MLAEELAAEGTRRTKEDAELEAIWNEAPKRRAPKRAQPSSSEEDSDDASDDDAASQSSEDSAIVARREAEKRIVDLGPDRSGPPPPTLLPSAGSAFDEVSGPPGFLNPEATRPLADTIHRQRLDAAAAAARLQQPGAEAGPRGGSEPWDISRMAPKLKGAEQEKQVGVISAAAVRYKSDDRVGTASAAAIAMLGGQIRGGADGDPNGADDSGVAGGRRTAAGAAGGRGPGVATKPMAVDEFLEKGVGGAALPRKRQDRRDKEKEKRMKGQSTHAEWKTEAEMALRQQYD